MSNTKSPNKDKLEFHPVANIMPMMSSTEFEALKLDVKANGLREPIVIYQDKIIDGRNRYNACLEVGIKPIFKEYKGEEKDLIDFVISLNINRRHLTKSQLSCLAVENIEYYEKKTKENLSIKLSNIKKGIEKKGSKSLNTLQILSRIFGVSERYISEAKSLYLLDVNIFNQVKKGELLLSVALKNIKQFASVQKVALDTKAPETLSNAVIDVKLTKNDIKQFNKLVSLGTPEAIANEFIKTNRLELLEQKNKLAASKKDNGKAPLKSIRLKNEDKEKIMQFAKNKNKSIPDLLSDLIKKLK